MSVVVVARGQGRAEEATVSLGIHFTPTISLLVAY